VATGSEVKVTFSLKSSDIKDVERDVDENGLSSDNRQAILNIMIADPTITAKDISERIGITHRNAQRHIAKLKEAGIVKRIGPDRGGKWLVKAQSDTAANKKDVEE
jgi:predicted HTH transcriptional regulator